MCPTSHPKQYFKPKTQEMANSISFLIAFVCVLSCIPICFCDGVPGAGSYLYPQLYERTCPKALDIVKSVAAEAVAREPFMAASLLRLHFHDCFVKGCDASILLDSRGTTNSEKRAVPNRDSARGFEVIDEIKYAFEKECPSTVSCSDILALSARDSTILAGGPSWEVPLGRRDSTGASFSGANNNIPTPNNTFQTILTKFKLKGLDIVDLVTLSGSHTIGNARCAVIWQRLYNQTGNGLPDVTLNPYYANRLRAGCPRSGGDQNLFVLGLVTPFTFDNGYFKNLMANKGLLSSDQILVEKFAASNEAFFEQFAKSMVRMGNVSPPTGSKGEIRKR